MKPVNSDTKETGASVTGPEVDKEQIEGLALLELMHLAEQDIAKGKTFTCEEVLEMLETDFRKP